MLGFDHAFGPSVNPKGYEVAFCVMGNSGVLHPIVPQPSVAEIQNTIGPGNIWFSERRLAVANLDRTKGVGPSFAATTSVVRVKRGTVHQVRLMAASGLAMTPG
jgi:hypothetical protein